jgi:hypothetical protein
LGSTESLQSAFTKVNTNFSTLDSALAAKADVSFFETRAALGAANIGTAHYVRVARYEADRPVCDILYEIVDAKPTRDPTSMSVTARDGSGNVIQRWTRLANLVTNPFMFGAYGDAAPMGRTLTYSTYVAKKAVEHDDTVALQNHLNYLKDGDIWTSGSHNAWFAVSSTLQLTRHRVIIDFSTLVPYGSFDGYLLDSFQAPDVSDPDAPQGPDPTMINVSMQLNMRRLRVCGRWQSRGVRFRDLYLSYMANLHVTHCYGTGLKLEDSYENSWFMPMFNLNKDRVAFFPQTAVAWNNGSVYHTGDIVYMDYPAYNADTTYGMNDLVTYVGGVFRSIAYNNVGNTPSPNGPWWVRDEFEYYQAFQDSQGASPLSASPDYTFFQDPPASGSPDRRIWRQVLVHEPLIDITNTQIPTVVDHEYFWGLDVRDNSNLEMMRVDQMGSSRPMYCIELYGGHFEGFTPGIAAESGYAIASSEIAARANATYLRLSRAGRCKIVGTTVRVGGQGSTGIRIGGQHPNNQTFELHLQNTDINGEDPYQIGIYVGVGQAELKQYLGVINIQLPDATSLKVVDPAARLNNCGWEVQQRFFAGQVARPGIAFANDPTAGLYSASAGSYSMVSGNNIRATFGPSLSAIVNPTLRVGVGNSQVGAAAQAGDIAVEFTNNNTLTFRAKGSDGVIRSGTINLS